MLNAVGAAVVAASLITQSPQTITKTTESIVQIKATVGENTMLCTGFVVGISWVITAKHCIPEGTQDVMVDERASKVLKVNEAFALLEVPPLKYPILNLRKDRPKVGEAVTSLGYPYGFPLMAFKRNVAAFCECGFAKGDHLIMDNRIGMGMSGGPVIDESGKVVGLNQAGVETISIACTAQEIKEFLDGK